MKVEFPLNVFPEFAEFSDKQGCIPVGCVPPAAVAVCWGGGGVCLSACWNTSPGPGYARTGPGPGPLKVWAWTPPPRPDRQPPPGLGPRHPPCEQND